MRAKKMETRMKTVTEIRKKMKMETKTASAWVSETDTKSESVLMSERTSASLMHERNGHACTWAGGWDERHEGLQVHVRLPVRTSQGHLLPGCQSTTLPVLGKCTPVCLPETLPASSP
jgi:hypothetical protein